MVACHGWKSRFSTQPLLALGENGAVVFFLWCSAIMERLYSKTFLIFLNCLFVFALFFAREISCLLELYLYELLKVFPASLTAAVGHETKKKTQRLVTMLCCSLAPKVFS